MSNVELPATKAYGTAQDWAGARPDALLFQLSHSALVTTIPIMAGGIRH